MGDRTSSVAVLADVRTLVGGISAPATRPDRTVKPETLWAVPVDRDPAVVYRTPTVLEAAPADACFAAWSHYLMAIKADAIAFQVINLRRQSQSSLTRFADVLLKADALCRVAYLQTPEQVVQALRRPFGPVLVASSWTTKMLRPDRDGYMDDGGVVVGKTACVVVGYSEPRRAFRVQPAFGASWGQIGRAWLPTRTQERFFANAEILAAEPW
jgi:hypothetical protein